MGKEGVLIRRRLLEPNRPKNPQFLRIMREYVAEKGGEWACCATLFMKTCARKLENKNKNYHKKGQGEYFPVTVTNLTFGNMLHGECYP